MIVEKCRLLSAGSRLSDAPSKFEAATRQVLEEFRANWSSPEHAGHVAFLESSKSADPDWDPTDWLLEHCPLHADVWTKWRESLAELQACLPEDLRLLFQIGTVLGSMWWLGDKQRQDPLFGPEFPVASLETCLDELRRGFEAFASFDPNLHAPVQGNASTGTTADRVYQEILAKLSPSTGNVFKKVGNTWTIGYEGDLKEGIKTGKALDDIHYLLLNQGRSINIRDLPGNRPVRDTPSVISQEEVNLDEHGRLDGITGGGTQIASQEDGRHLLEQIVLKQAKANGVFWREIA
jgi:hypothetical protein